MKEINNVYNIRRKESLMYILPSGRILRENSPQITEKIAIAINLYYFESVDFYLKYIDNIPKEIDVYIISSNPKIWNVIENYKKTKSKVYLMKKENRGRDISALLVAFRKKALEYEYICFLHDKKEHHDYLKKEVNNWICNLWNNTIGTEKYIENVLNIFRENPLIGILAPPEPIGDYFESWYGDVWTVNFENTDKLAKELDLYCNLERDKQPITIGTVFWAKTCSLNKLLKKEWSYSDFPEEPMAEDGTISHAIERIFAYVAQDAGYKTGTIMTSSYAEWKLLFIQDGMRKMNSLLKQNLGVHALYQIDEEYIKDFRQAVKELFINSKAVYIYGAGVFGKEMLIRIRMMGLEPEGFVVSDGKRKDSCVENLKVYELNEIVNDMNNGIIISLNYDLQERIAKSLLKIGFTNFIRGNVIQYK